MSVRVENIEESVSGVHGHVFHPSIELDALQQLLFGAMLETSR